MSDAWRPAGAPTDDPPGWQWWIPREPAWSAWINGQKQRYRTAAFCIIGVFAASVVAGLLAPGMGWPIGLPVLGALASLLAGIGCFALYRRLRKDPLVSFREEFMDAGDGPWSRRVLDEGD
jgi:hypothetical protein